MNAKQARERSDVARQQQLLNTRWMQRIKDAAESGATLTSLIPGEDMGVNEDVVSILESLGYQTEWYVSRDITKLRVSW